LTIHGVRAYGMVFVYATISLAESASIEALYNEIDKLPPQQRQKRLEDGARREGKFKFYGISAAALLDAYTRGFMKKYPFIKASLARQRQQTSFSHVNRTSDRSARHRCRTGRTENVMTLKRSGIWVRYHSPESENFGKDYTDKTVTGMQTAWACRRSVTTRV